MAKKKYSDNYFLNLTMDFDKRDDDIYPKWAIWCANSNGKYTIDGKDGHFYTRIRTDEEIEIERKINLSHEMLFSYNRTNVSKEKQQEYENYIHEYCRDKEKLLNTDLLDYDEWKTNKKQSAE